jgi:hypothetical protein
MSRQPSVGMSVKKTVASPFNLTLRHGTHSTTIAAINFQKNTKRGIYCLKTIFAGQLLPLFAILQYVGSIFRFVGEAFRVKSGILPIAAEIFLVEEKVLLINQAISLNNNVLSSL